MSSLTALGLAGGAVAVEASPAYAANPVYAVVNPDNDGTKSIYDRNSPHWGDSDRKYPDFSYYGDRLELICGTNGDSVGPYSNKRWHYAKNLSRPEAGTTWIPDRYMDTPNKANQPTPGERECGATEQKPQAPNPVKACYFNLKAPSKNLALSYAGDHRYYGNVWQAAKNWSDTGAGIKINPTKNNVDAYIRVKDVNVNESWYAKVDIPAKADWMGPHKTVPSNPRLPKTLTLLMNKRYMDGLNDFERTLVATHELGHTLGLAHTNGAAGCNISNESIMKEGNKDTTFTRGFNTPRTFDENQLKQLLQRTLRISMGTKKIMQSKKVRIGTATIFVALIAGVFAFKIFNRPTITSYKDEQFFIYECSQPIKAKHGSVPDLMGGRMDALIPADQNEAKRYCEVTGVE